MTPPASPRVVVVVLNWNGAEDTVECLASVEAQAYREFEIVVVDNGSTDDSVRRIQASFPGVTILRHEQNLGFTGGSNAGMQYAMAQGAAYMWLLNNDAIVEPDTLGKLVDLAEANADLGLVSPRILFFDAPETVQFLGAYADFAGCAVVECRDGNELEREPVRSRVVLFGTALLVRNALVHRVGYLNDKFFAYHEDYDYSIRSLQAGFRNAVHQDARVLHKDSRSTGRDSPVKAFLRARNNYFLWSELQDGLRLVFFGVRYIGMMLPHLRWLRDHGRQASLEASMSGLWAGLADRGGAYDAGVRMPAWLRKVVGVLVAWHPDFWCAVLTGNLEGIAGHVGRATRYSRRSRA